MIVLFYFALVTIIVNSILMYRLGVMSERSKWNKLIDDGILSNKLKQKVL